MSSVGHIIYLVRHPYNVLTSHHSNSMRGFYTTLECWTNQFEAFELLANLRTSEDELFIVRNEGDLITQPNIMQQRLPEVFELRPRIPFNCFF